jgi:hypothetical protein
MDGTDAAAVAVLAPLGAGVLVPADATAAPAGARRPHSSQ